ncbi:MAG: hypothetical protein AB8B71_16360 [Paracoccaceae bacterium]
MDDLNYYRLFGLNIASELELPELGPPLIFDPLQNAQVVISLGPVPKSLAGGTRVNEYYEFSEDACLVDVKGIAQYQVSQGATLLVEPVQGAAENDVRTYLFGTVLSVLLHQRKLLPLHIGAVASPAGVIAFTGESGAGKSTLAGLLHKRSGWPMVCDDLAVVQTGTPHPILHGGMLRLKLWRETINRLEVPATTVTRDTTRHDKYHLISPDLFITEPRPLAALFVLGKGDRPILSKLTGGAAFSAVMNTIYRPEFAAVFSDQKMIMQSCAEIAKTIDVYRFDRPWDVAALDAGADYLIEYFSEKDASTRS